MARRYNSRRVKIHRAYSVSEVEKLFDVHPHTVRRWIATGLPLVDEPRPYLIHGTALRAFLSARQPRKQPLRPGEIYCVACRAPKRPDGDMAEYRSRGPSRGDLVGICPTCDRIIHRRVNLAKIDLARGDLAVEFPKPELRLIDSFAPLSNVAFRQDGQT
jgi:hypothetical protein